MLSIKPSTRHSMAPATKNDRVSSAETERLWFNWAAGGWSCCGSTSEMIAALGGCTTLGICRRYRVMEGEGRALQAEGPGLQFPN